MSDKFISFMNNLPNKLKARDCDIGETEFKTKNEFDICMSQMMILGAELIDEMFN
jgi:hypothetical protein